MADKHPYISGPGNLVKVITHFRKSFPTTISAETLKKLGFAPKNESYVLNVLRFLGMIDEEGKKTELASKTFSLHDDAAFKQEFAKIVKKSYSDLFNLHAEGSWTLQTDALIAYFRTTDETTAIVGKLQAATFQLLAAFAGHGEVPAPKTSGLKSAAPSTKSVKRQTVAPQASKQTTKPALTSNLDGNGPRNFGLTVRIEINLPADGNQETYDRIFESIRKNFLND